MNPFSKLEEAIKDHEKTPITAVEAAELLSGISTGDECVKWIDTYRAQLNQQYEQRCGSLMSQARMNGDHGDFYDATITADWNALQNYLTSLTVMRNAVLQLDITDPGYDPPWEY